MQIEHAGVPGRDFEAAITAGQAMQQAKAGIEAVYLSGWQVAADGNTSETMYPDQSLYAYDSVPTMVRRINNSFKRADEIQWSRDLDPDDEAYIDYFLPIVADAEAGFGGMLNAFELMKNMIAAGAALTDEQRGFAGICQLWPHGDPGVDRIDPVGRENWQAIEESVLHDRRIIDLLAQENIVPMKVDITGKNPAGKAKLKAVGSLTVPLLVVFAPDGKPVFKSDFYTVDQVLGAVEKALGGN